MAGEFSGKVTLATGVGSGIGFAIASALPKEDARS